jgi:hypothetical protein
MLLLFSVQRAILIENAGCARHVRTDINPLLLHLNLLYGDAVTPVKCLSYAMFQYFFFCLGVRLSPLGTSATVWPIIPAPDDI